MQKYLLMVMILILNEWHNGTTPISKADIEAKMVEVQADYDAKQYQRDRVYPSIGDQLDMLWHSIDQDPELKSKYFISMKL